MPAEIQNYSVKTYDRRHITTNRVKLRPIEVDHAVPKSKDSQDNDKNLLLYGHCNYVKDNRTMAEARVGLAESGARGA